MKLYYYELHESYSSNPISLTIKEVECEEKPSTYRLTPGQGCFCSMVKKDDIGRILGTWGTHMFLLENDIAKAASIFIMKKESELKKVEEKVNKFKADIEVLKNITN